MGKIKAILTATVLATLAVGCASNIKQIGTVGDTTFYRARSSTFSGPNALVIIEKNNVTEHAQIAQAFGGSGIGPSIISAVGQTGASVLLGRSFPKNVGDNISANGGSTTATANGGAASSVANSSSHTSSTATSSSNSTATGGAGGAGGTGGTATGKGHPDSPGNGGEPGNGGQNGNGHNP